jgi:hypothetical protein
MAAKATYRQEPDAEQTIAELCGPQVLDTANTVADQIPNNVPQRTGHSRQLFRQGLRAQRDEHGAALVTGLPPHWHWFEHGTRWNPPYSPIRRTVEQLGMRWQSK